MHQGYLLKVTLLHVSPPVWRQMWVPCTISLRDLHSMIQLAMGWTNSHLHAFFIDGRQYGRPDDEFEDGTFDDQTALLENVLAKIGQKFIYEYDFGDSWIHEVVFEDRPAQALRVARVLGGEGSCPPEDCGGPYGYEDILRVMKKARRTAEEQELFEWLPDGFDPGKFDIDEANRSLAKRFGD